MTTLSAILETLKNQILSTGTWSLSLDDLEAATDQPVTLYRAVYDLGLIGRDVYAPSSAGELLSLLERAAAPDAEQRMRKAGLFLNYEDRIRLTERFVRHVRRAIVLHVPEPEMFRGMVNQFKRYDIAENAYRDTYLSLAPIIEDCSSEHADGTKSAAIRQLTAKWYLQTLIDRKIVLLPELGPSLFDLLRAIGRQEGALPPTEEEDRKRGAAAAERNSGADDRDGALALLRLHSQHPSRAEIRGQYRKLMRRFHPDINAGGLEMAKQINSAYAVLLTNGDRF